MKKIKGLLSGFILGAAAMFYGIWHWEKSNRKRISTVADKYYNKALLYANNLIDTYGEDAKQKLEEIIAQTKVYLRDTLKLSRKDIDNIIVELKKDLGNKLGQAKQKIAESFPKKKK